MQRTGKILTHTVIRVPPAPFTDQAPYAVAVVEMDDGPRITTQVVDWNEGQLKIGQTVKLEFRQDLRRRPRRADPVRLQGGPGLIVIRHVES